MRIINHRTRRHNKNPSKRWLRRLFWFIGGLAALFVLINGVLWVGYRGKVLPNVKAAELPARVMVEYQETQASFEADKAGITVHQDETKKQLAQRSWLPLLDIIRGRRIPLVIEVEQKKFTEALRQIEPIFEKSALPKRVVFSGNSFALADPVPGYRLDEIRFTQGVKDAFAKGKTTLEAPIEQTNTNESSGVGLDDEVAKLNSQLKTKISFSVNGQTKQPTAAETGAWYKEAAFPTGVTMALAEEKVKAYVLGVAPSASNAGNAAAAVSYALDKKTDITFVISTAAAVSYKYCASSTGVGAEHMSNFVAKVAATLGDPRGWNAGGKVSFERVDNGCDFVVWLSHSSRMTSFGGACDPYYSCRSGRNVVINFDRWQGATDPWNASGGSLEDYRVMVTNHEVGHWLGFGHSNCSGPGQPAPVMQQQSISLQGCVFNPWPTAAEISTLKQNKGVTAMQPREEYIAESSCACGRHA